MNDTDKMVITERPNWLLGACIMVKDEEKNIRITLMSLRGVVDVVYILDTGSTDNTREVITKFCKENNIELFYQETTFQDYSTSRNQLLKFAEYVIFRPLWVLLLDANDVVEGGQVLRKMISENGLYRGSTAYNVKQRWYETNGVVADYYNVRLIQLKQGWYYIGAIHETLTNDDKSKHHPPILEDLEQNHIITISQNRARDNARTVARMPKDILLLMKDYERLKKLKNKSENETVLLCRTLFYLGQTYLNMSSSEGISEPQIESYLYRVLKFLGERVELYPEINPEETYNCIILIGNVHRYLDKESFDKAFDYYHKAMVLNPQRVEAFIPVVEHYLMKDNILMAFMYCNFACRLSQPRNLNLCVDRYVWDCKRWRLHAIVNLAFGYQQTDLFLAGFESLGIYLENMKNLGKTLTKEDEALVAEYARCEELVRHEAGIWSQEERAKLDANASKEKQMSMKLVNA